MAAKRRREVWAWPTTALIPLVSSSLFTLFLFVVPPPPTSPFLFSPLSLAPFYPFLLYQSSFYTFYVTPCAIFFYLCDALFLFQNLFSFAVMLSFVPSEPS